MYRASSGANYETYPFDFEQFEQRRQRLEALLDSEMTRRGIKALPPSVEPLALPMPSRVKTDEGSPMILDAEYEEQSESHKLARVLRLLMPSALVSVPSVNLALLITSIG